MNGKKKKIKNHEQTLAIICLSDKYRPRASNKYGFLSIVSRFLSLIIFMSVINIKILPTIGLRSYYLFEINFSIDNTKFSI